MNNDAEAREVHATMTDSEESGKPVNGYQDEPVSDDRSEPTDRPDPADEDDEMIDPDAIIIAGDSGDLDDSDDLDEADLDEADLDEADDDTHPDTVASAIVVEPVTADDSLEPLPGDATVAEPVSADDTVVDPVSADDTLVDPVSADDIAAEPVPGAEPASTTAGPKHAAADSAAVKHLAEIPPLACRAKRPNFEAPRRRRLSAGSGGLREMIGNPAPAVDVARIAGDCKIVGNRLGLYSKLGFHTICVTHDLSTPVDLHNPRPHDTLAKVFVGRADQYLLNPSILGGLRGGGCERVIRLEIGHGPDHHAHGLQTIF